MRVTERHKFNKKELEEFAEKGLSCSQIAKLEGCDTSSIVRRLQKFGIKTRRKKYKFYCSKCKTVDKENFYDRLPSICKKCCILRKNKYLSDRRNRLILSKGGKCQICNYNKCNAALCFHHKDPENKDPDFRNLSKWSFKRAILEVQKCALLCHNCHMELHYREI